MYSDILIVAWFWGGVLRRLFDRATRNKCCLGYFVQTHFSQNLLSTCGRVWWGKVVVWDLREGEISELVLSDKMFGEMLLQKNKTALLCVDLQKCYYTHPTTQHFPNLEKVWSNSHVNSRWMQFVNQRWSVACSATSERPRLRLCMLCRRTCLT